MKTTVVFMLAALILATGCWNDKEEISSAVWSDDDTEQAYIKLLFEQSSSNPNPFLGSSRRNFRHQIYVQRADGSNRRAVTGVRDNIPGGFFFYMRRAGYILINVIESSTVTRIDLIRTADGSSHTLHRLEVGEGPVTPCMGAEALPSPDGSVIAVMERQPPTSSGCNGGLVIVDFVDAGTLRTIASHQWSLDGMPGLSWSREGELFVWNYTGGSWRVDPVLGPISSPAPTCTQPRTSSSNVSDDGVLIAGGTLGDPVDVLSSDAPNCW